MESDAQVPAAAEARRALDQVESTRATTLLGLMAPRWYTVARYAMAGAAIATLGLSDPWETAVVLVLMVSLVGAQAYELRTGRRLSPRRGTGPGRHWRIPALGVTAALMVLGYVIHRARPDLPAVPVLLGVVVFVVGAGLELQGDIRRRKQLRARE